MTPSSDMIRCDIGCACHALAKANAQANGAANMFDCPGAINLYFPVRMFEPSGELEYRDTRQRFVRDSLKIFDEFYERARMDLSQKEPLIIRPKRTGRMLAVVDSDDLKPSTEAQPVSPPASGNEIEGDW